MLPSARSTHVSAIAVLTVLVLAACANAPASAPSVDSSVTPSPSAEAQGFTLASPDLDAGGYLPDWAINGVPGYCEGTENRSPVLQWSNPPEGTASFVLTMTDPANPEYVHWVVTGIPADTASVPQAADGDIAVGVTGTNWVGPGNYAGVCLANNPYLYTVYALDEMVVGDATTTLDDALAMMAGNVLASAELSVRGH